MYDTIKEQKMQYYGKEAGRMSAILLEKKGHVAILTVSRPEALNALNSEVLGELADAIDDVAQDEDIYVAVLTGAGKAFVAGADIGEMKDLSAVGGKKFGEFGNSVFLKIEQMEKPVIAAVNGFALGGGCELALCCDIRIAGEKARFGQPETGLGITPGFGGTQRLPRTIGMSRAKELIYTTRQIKADEAEKIGLVSRTVPQDELMETAIALAEDIAKNAQIAVRQSKAAINRGMQCDIATGLAFESEAFGLCFGTEDQKAAMNAFVSKEKLEGFKNK